MIDEPPRWIDRLIAARWPCAVLAIVLAAACVVPAFSVRFNRSIENMFAPHDPLLAPYEVLKTSFGGNEIVLAVYDDPELLNPDGRGIRRLAEIGTRLRAIGGVREVLTLDRPIGDVIVDPNSRVAAALREVFAGYTHSTDGRTAAAVCMFDPAADSPTRVVAIARIREIIESLPDGLAPGQIAGEPVLVEEGFQQLEADGQRLAVWSTILLALSLAVSLRSFRWILVPLAVVQFAIITTRALLVVVGLRLTMVSSMLAAILTVVGIATAVHVAVQYRELRDEGRSRVDALRVAAVILVGPIVWSCITDAFGFGSLMVSQVGPVRDFGLMTAVGSLLVLVGMSLIVPLGALAGADRPSAASRWGDARIRSLLQGMLDGVQRWPLPACVAILALAAVGLSGVGRLEVETDFTKNFRASSPIVRSYSAIESRFGGAGVLDVVLPAPDSLSYAYLEQVMQLERRLRREVQVQDEQGRTVPGLTKVLSPADAILAAATPEVLPEMARDLAVRVSWDGMCKTIPAFADALHARHFRDPDQWLLRIMLRARERQPAAEKLRLIAQVRRIVDEELQRPEWDSWADRTASGENSTRAGFVTGYFVLLTHLIESLVRDQWLSFGFASAGVGLCLVLALRNVKLAILALVPNALPVVLVLGLLGWAGMRMNLGAAMIAAVSMGLTVDGSLHYLMGYRRHRAAGMSVAAALEQVQAGVGRAMLLSTLALVVGFSVLCTSQFVPTITFGWLMSLAMCGGLLGNLFVLPLLVTLTERRVA